MAVIKDDSADRFVASPPDGIRLFLVHGPDAGGVTERARALERVALSRGRGDVVQRFASDMISSEPGRIAEEAYSASLFGGEPVVALRITDGRHNAIGAVKPLLERPPEAAWLIVEAGELAPSSPLRKSFEESPRAAAIATYPVEGQGLLSLIRMAAEECGATIEPDAMELLAANLGGDRLQTRGELDKLFLYVAAPGPVSAADVEAIVGDSAALRTDDVIDAALLGDSEALETGLDRLAAEAGSMAALGAQALRHALLLHGLRLSLDAGRSMDAVLASARPPVFWRRKPAVVAQLKRWSSPGLAGVRSRIAEAILITRRFPNLERAATSEALHAVALAARRLR